MAHNHVIFVAGGSGKRMGKELPKQFIPVADKPLLMWAIEAFEAYDPTLHKVVAVPYEHQGLWKDLCKQFNFQPAHDIATGGKTRFDTVKNACRLIDDKGLTGVHDGVRPFPARDTISRAYTAADKYGAAIPFVKSIDSLRIIEHSHSKAIKRNQIIRVQTPQVFRSDLLKKAYQQPFQKEFTDDASVVEQLGINIHLVQGNEENIKVTHKMDLRIAIMLAKYIHST
ncbi:MAG: 2-C-methyl-D-erythritol 4-phosphate cytidylyltransferase [Bacteroidales bacterium]